MLWRIEDGKAFRFGGGISQDDPRNILDIPGDSDPINGVMEMLRGKFGEPEDESWVVEHLNLPPGGYFPRIARPHHQHPYDAPSGARWAEQGYAHEEAAATLQLRSLAARLEAAFQIVDPDAGNLSTFGGEFRNILILAATEFETQSKVILRANHYSKSEDDRWNTGDFIKVEPALRLSDYAIKFTRYPWLEQIAPFRGWTREQPTKSLEWYDAHNAVKHDREKRFRQASLENALQAVAGVVAICVAEFGAGFLRSDSTLQESFQIAERPLWSIGDAHGASHVQGWPTIAVDYPF